MSDADFTVEIVADGDDPAYKVLVVEGGAALSVDMSGAADGEVLTVQADGTIAPEAAPAGVTDHGALTGLADDDHPQYTTSAEATTLAAAEVTTHAAAADPHAGYQKESEKGAASGYGSLDAASRAPADEVNVGFALLAECSDEDSTLQNVSTSTTTWAAIDGTRLESVTFDAPASGAVDVECEAVALCERTSVSTLLQWGVLEGGAIVAASIVGVILSADNGIQVAARVRTRARISGLTPGAETTYTWAHRRAVGDGPCSTIWGGADTTKYGRAQMRVLEVPTPLV